MSDKPLQLVWFRQDLRVSDNPALYYASQKGNVIGVYIDTATQYKLHNESEAKIGLRQALVKQLRDQLSKLSIPLLIVEAETFEDSEPALLDILEKHKVQALWLNKEYLLNECERDKKIIASVKRKNFGCHTFDGDLILEPNQLKTLKGEPYRVFTPYKKAWLKLLEESNTFELPVPAKQGLEIEKFQSGELEQDADYRQDLWHQFREGQQSKFESFLKQQQYYSERRDIPSINGTSRLSPYLSLGSLSARELANQVIKKIKLQGGDWRQSVWLSELIWRDFYRQIMIDNMEALCKHRAFKKRAEPWLQNEEGLRRFTAWKTAATGFPIIDAAMRQLNQTAWMHNRLRMVTSMFLTKLCLVDWRWGEKYFMQQLIDGDFASNNGGWQWCASTGADSVPYFRIMNPIAQSKRFDSQGKFIKKFLPELAELNDKDIHFPTEGQRTTLGYPQPIIDYPAARKLALELLA